MVAIKRNEGVLTVQTASGQTVGGGGWTGGSGAGQKIGGVGVGGGGAGQKTGGLVGMYICIANNDAGNVTLTVNVSLTGTKIAGPEVGEIGGHQLVDIVSSGLTNVRLSAAPDDDQQLDIIGDQVVNSNRTTSFSKKFPTSVGKNNSTSTLGGSVRNRTNVVVKEGERLFTVLEFVCSILGTHVCTLLVCLLTVSKLYQCKVKPGTSVDKPLPNGFTNDAPDKNDPVSILPTQSVYINNQGRHFIVPDYSITSAFVAK